MKIEINILGQFLIPFEVAKDESVDKLKKNLENTLNVSSDRQILTYRGYPLRDKKSLSFYQIVCFLFLLIFNVILHFSSYSFIY